MKNAFFFAFALLGTALVSCERQKNESCDEPVSFAYNVPFTLCQGNTGFWAENDEFSIVFEKVTEDSRCPEDAVCIWAGSVDFALRFNNFDQAFNDTLGIGSMKHPIEVEFSGRTIRLLAVTPETTHAGQSIPQNEYKVTLVVEE